jgi:hypothetical protein
VEEKRMKRLFAMTIGAAVISLSLLMAPLAFAKEAAKDTAKPAETGAAAATDSSKEKPCEPKPVKHKKKSKKKAAKKAEEKKTEEAAPAPAEKK